MYLVAVALCAALSLVDISGAQPCVGRDGQIDPKSKCGDCTVRGDPEIKTYVTHTLSDLKSITNYTVPGGHKLDDKYAISQLGKDSYPVFGVSAQFKQGAPGWERTVSFVSTVTYTEFGINVELILPEKLDTFVSPIGVEPKVFFCQTSDAAHDPGCATKIIVGGTENFNRNDGTVSSFPETAGTVQIFQVGACNSSYCHIVVEGSKGITVSLVVDPTLAKKGRDGYDHDYLYYLNVYSTPSLHGKLYGLCDTFTASGDTNQYTPRSGSPITVWSETNIKKFIESWKVIPAATCGEKSCGNNAKCIGGHCICRTGFTGNPSINCFKVQPSFVSAEDVNIGPIIQDNENINNSG